MRRMALLLITTLIFASCLFADVTTDSATLNVSAYKETPIPSMAYTITIKDFNNSNLTGVTSVLDISNKMKTSRTLENAFTITITSNLKTPIPVVIEFSPLINQEDATADLIPVTYTMTKDTLSQVIGTKRIRVNNSNNVVTNGGTRYYYAYTPAIALTGNATSVVADVDGASTTLTHSIGTIKRTTSNTTTNFNNNATTVNTVPNDSSTSVLPGFASGQVLTSSAKFNLALDEDDYNDMAANMDYYATVKLTITPL